MDLLCLEPFKIGLIGSMYFIGVVISSVIAPPLADAYGRKYVFFGSELVQLSGLIGLLFVRDIWGIYICMVLVGLSYAGMILIGINYVVELQKKEW